MVITYQNAHVRGETTVCAAHVGDARLPALGAVSHGARAGDCDICQLDWEAEQEPEQTYPHTLLDR